MLHADPPVLRLNISRSSCIFLHSLLRIHLCFIRLQKCLRQAPLDENEIELFAAELRKLQVGKIGKLISRVVAWEITLRVIRLEPLSHAISFA